MTPASQPIRIHLAQIAPVLGDLRRNVDLHLERVSAAGRERADLVVFPELSLTGYWLHDLVADVAVKPGDDPRLEPLREASRTVDILAGLVEAGEDGQIYNSAVWFRQGRVLHVHRKLYLPTYTLFDEGRYFARGDRVRSFDSPFGRTGVLVCEDLWHPALTYLLAQEGCDLLLVPSSSPGRGIDGDGLGSQHAWELLGESAARFLTQFVVYVGRVGSEDGHIFGGASFVYGPDGRRLAGLDPVDEDGVTVELEPGEIPRARQLSPLLRDERAELVHRELGRILNTVPPKK